ncbi:MAG: hypothetical protein Q8Q09_19155 [Deltaproteobacteria bacterium]|nr:hypothetical protein [Deltaproteobacteria bacterium]
MVHSPLVITLRNALVRALLVTVSVGGLPACERLFGAVPEDVVLGGPRTLGFVEMGGRMASPELAFTGAISELGEGGASSDAASESDPSAGDPWLDAGTGSEASVLEDLQDPEGPPGPEQGAMRWRYLSLRAARARAVDLRGHRHALRDDAVIDEETGERQALNLDDISCQNAHEHLAFDTHGAGYAVRAGRVFLRAAGQTRWARTPVCTNIHGEPWVSESHRGWGLLARRTDAREAAILHTRDAPGATGWYALMAVGATVSAAVLDDDGSRLVLESGGHPVLVDVTRVVAGAVLATASVPFAGVTRTGAGVVVWRSSGDVADLLVASRARGPYVRQAMSLGEREERQSLGPLLGVWALDGDTRVAVLARGVVVSRGSVGHVVQRWTQPWTRPEGVSVSPATGGGVRVVGPLGEAQGQPR